MIKVTLKELVTIAQSGAYARFKSIRKTIPAGHINRKVPAAVQEELKQFDEARNKLVKQFGGVLSEESEGKSTYVFGEKFDDFVKEFEELLSQTVELPGEAINRADLLDGGLIEEDHDLLTPFLAE